VLMGRPTPIDLTDPTVVALFKHSVYVTSVYWIIGIALAFVVATALLRRTTAFNLSPAGLNEPRNRTYLRMAFGLIWLIDGILQFQASMPLGLASDVVQPSAAGTPGWLHALILVGVGIWNNHPIALAVGTAWIQVGIGIVLLVSNAAIGRIVAAVSVGWAAMIWLVGNGAGGIFSSSNNILFGWPGATLFYMAAGVWLALPPRVFQERFSRYTLRFMSVVVAAGAVLQLLPDRGFWRGGNNNALTSMTQSMTQTPQPHWIASFATGIGDLAGRMGGGFNIIVVLWLAGCAAGLWLASIHGWRWPIWTFVVGCAFFWFVAEDAAVFGGLATDLNSLVPMAALTWCASPALERLPALPRRLPRELRSSTGSVLASFAAAMVLFSIVTMSWASAVAAPETTRFLAQDGPAQATNTRAPGFTLTDQFNKRFTLDEHKGYDTLLTFLDPVCWTDCPLLAGQLRQVRSRLPANAKLDTVAVTADIYYRTLPYLKHFIKIHDMSSVKGFYYVTGQLAQLRKIWNEYGITVIQTRSDKMSVHSDYMFVINPRGQLKWIVSDDPPSNVAGRNSAASELLSLLHSAGLAA
jgi:cytochrome oxidase Cu insertion factor (SCO1/SenC/PrrC family)